MDEDGDGDREGDGEVDGEIESSIRFSDLTKSIIRESSASQFTGIESMDEKFSFSFFFSFWCSRNVVRLNGKGIYRFDDFSLGCWAWR